MSDQPDLSTPHARIDAAISGYLQHLARLDQVAALLLQPHLLADLAALAPAPTEPPADAPPALDHA
jgi:hypothetical protein